MNTRKGKTPAPLKHVDIIGGHAERGQKAVIIRVAKMMSRLTNVSVQSVSLLSLHGGDKALPEAFDLRLLPLVRNPFGCVTDRSL
jgi:hypothetical protein